MVYQIMPPPAYIDLANPLMTICIVSALCVLTIIWSLKP